MQKREAVGEDESLPEAAQDLEALAAETLLVQPSASVGPCFGVANQLV